MGSKKASPETGGGDGGGGKAAHPPELPPFLTKLYEMAEDAETDAVVSWGSEGKSFVLWDPHAFARDLLPKYFKHANLSSFVRQLNTYGFRKVDPDRWEFANEGFIRGQRHLLKTITRRKPSHNSAIQNQQQSEGIGVTHAVEVGKYGGLVEEVEMLKRDRSVLMQELVSLRQNQQNSNIALQNAIQRLQVMEQNQQQMMALLAMVVQNPALLTQLVQQHGSNWWRKDANKKRRFHALVQGTTTGQKASNGHGQIIKYQPLVAEVPNPVTEVSNSTTAPPVPNTTSPMDMQPISNDVDNFGTALGTFDADPSFPEEWTEMADIAELFDGLSPAEQVSTSPPLKNGDHVDDQPLSIEDYAYFKLPGQENQMEATACVVPQHANVRTKT